jgi:hypothetical protein
MKRVFLGVAGVAIFTTWIFSATTTPQRGPAPAGAPPDLAGVYEVVSNDTTLPGGLRNTGSPAEIMPLPAALAQTKSVDLTQDPEKMCQPIGPFRMMAREGTKIELVPALAHGMIVMFFENLSHGLARTIYTSRSHPAKLAMNWLGDSVGQWEGNTLVVDTVGFNDRTWLNAKGAQHSDALHLIERIRPILEGKYLEYRVTAEDSKALAKPYTYTRYYEKLKTEIMEDVCEE